uniref:Bromo domain-containing protein n=1 Tax=Chaetoceros debilis TaxID=122233 RepID=A0A7S3V6D4_9STRA
MSTASTSKPSKVTDSDDKASKNASASTSSKSVAEEFKLRTQLYGFRKTIKSRQPLDPSYKFLIMKNSNVKAPHIHNDKKYVGFTADLREHVENYMNRYGTETPAGDGRRYTIGRHRENLDEEKMRAAFTLRECKEFEQKGFIKAELEACKSRRINGWLIEEGERKRKVEAMALGLQEIERKKRLRKSQGNMLASIKQKMLKAEKASLEQKKMLAKDSTEAAIIESQLKEKEKERVTARNKQNDVEAQQQAIAEARERERQLEKERQQAEEEERLRIELEREDTMRRTRRMETPQQALHRIYLPIFNALWDMEFFDGTNPFRIVIDKDNCAAMGAPDYCLVIQTPMNLTYIREKVNDYKYNTLQEFFEDVELVISNALRYNSDPNNPYHIAANDMKKKYIKLRQKVLMQLQG